MVGMMFMTQRSVVKHMEKMGVPITDRCLSIWGGLTECDGWKANRQAPKGGLHIAHADHCAGEFSVRIIKTMYLLVALLF